MRLNARDSLLILMPAQKRRKHKKSIKPLFERIYFVVFIIAIILFLGLFLAFKTDKWNSKHKVILAVRNIDNSLNIIVFDPQLEEIYDIAVPENTEIEVAGGYGVWKVKSLWDLGKQEGLSGDLLARSVIMGLKIPVYAWADNEALGLAYPKPRNFLTSLFSPYETNLLFGDKLRLFLFSSKVKNTKRVKLDLGETAYLEKMTLSDGEKGYKVSDLQPQSITAIFSEQALSSDVVRFSIKDSTGKNMAAKVASLIEVLGGKVSLVETQSGFDGLCILKAKNEEILEILKKVFECEENILDEGQSFDVDLTLGSKFSERY